MKYYIVSVNGSTFYEGIDGNCANATYNRCMQDHIGKLIIMKSAKIPPLAIEKQYIAREPRLYVECDSCGKRLYKDSDKVIALSMCDWFIRVCEDCSNKVKMERKDNPILADWSWHKEYSDENDHKEIK